MALLERGLIYISSALGSIAFEAVSVGSITASSIWAFVAINGVIEASVNFIVAASLAKVIHKFTKTM